MTDKPTINVPGTFDIKLPKPPKKPKRRVTRITKLGGKANNRRGKKRAKARSHKPRKSQWLPIRMVFTERYSAPVTSFLDAWVYSFVPKDQAGAAA